MTFSSLDAVLLTVAFLVPGFVWECTLQIFLRRRDDRGDRAWIRFLTLSALNYGLWSWLIYLLLIRFEVLGRPWVAALAWFCILFISPAVLGGITGLLSQRAIARRLLAGFGVRTVHAVPTAWDYVFSHSPPTGFWTLVTLVDGSTVAGIFTDRSFASSDPMERDLFLERVDRVEDDGTWQPVPMNRGVWIHGKALRAIEFPAFQE
jgi:hypothetical protein